MRAAPVCPRCGLDIHAPGVWSSAWTCQTHGPVDPLQSVGQPTCESIVRQARDSAVPVWMPWPLPRGWVATGMRCAGDSRTGTRGVAVACSGPAPLGGLGELVLVAESPGVGLGAGLAGIDGLDPGVHVTDRVPDAKVHAAGHPTPLWSVPAPADRAVFVGEALANWLWVVLWPGAAGYLVAEKLALIDLRDPEFDPDLPVGALSPRLVPAPLR